MLLKLSLTKSFYSIKNHNSSITNHKYLYAMNALRNKVQLIGRAGNDPEVKSLNGGKKVANINLATSEKYVNQKGEKVEDTQWHRVVAWGKTADIIDKYVTKGKEIAIEGKLSTRSYDDKNGEKRYITEITANEVLLLSSKS